MFRSLSRASRTLPAISQLLRAPAQLHYTMTAKPGFNIHQPIHWILDWDGTITRRDTLDALVSIAASAKPDSPVHEEWKRVSEAYMTDYTEALGQLAPDGRLPTTVQEERRLLQSLKSVEQASLARVSASGIFADLTQKLLEEGASNVINSKKVEIRNGFADFLQSKQTRSHDTLDLLSVNWSRHFISSCLKAAGVSIDKSSIYANELDGIESNYVSQGKISPENGSEMTIISSSDKLEYLTHLREQDNRPIIYMGDSWTDIECLLEADLGICIRGEPIGSSQKKLAERLESLGVHCPHLSDWREADEWQVVWAKDFAAVQAWLEPRTAQDIRSD
jgi:2-hydroxy-3-keto-5-methylthiopentenyl-1-phosphate phosphatase